MAASAAVLFGTGAAASGQSLARPRFGSYPFTLGVASGEPSPDGVVLWTRLAPDPLAADGLGGMNGAPVEVRYEVATDDRFRRVVRRGAVEARSELAHSVHPEVAGLRPDYEYFYRFKAGGEISPVGRTRTAPAPTARLRSLAFAVVSCQKWDEGYYTGYRHIAAEDLAFLVHLGDYIYENGVNATGGIRNQPMPVHLAGECFSLERYRLQYSLYKTDADLQAAHASVPWLVSVDDHEVENNWADEISQVDTEPDQDPAVFRQRRAAAFQAFYENLPLRIGSRPVGPDMQLYRRLRFGDLLELNMLDLRQYRDDQACGDGARVDCDARLDPARSITGPDQERWLFDGFRRSRARWNAIGQGVFVARLDHDAGAAQSLPMDCWDGYQGSRDRLFEALTRHRVANPVVLSGDIHRGIAAELKQDFDNPDSATVGVEFAGSSLSSGGNGQDIDPLGLTFLAANPHIKFNNTQRGYMRCTLDRETWRTDYRTLEFVLQPGAPVFTRRSFVVEEGAPALLDG